MPPFYERRDMKKEIFLCLSMLYSSFLFAITDETKDPNQAYYETISKNRAKYKAHSKESEAKEKAKVDIKRLVEDKKSEFQKEFSKDVKFDDDLEIKKSINKSYYKVLIKQRSKIKPDEYKYIKVKKREDLQKAGMVVDKNSKSKKVMNFVEIKNLHTNSFLKKEKVKNIGVVVDKKAKTPKKILNIIDVENSEFGEGKINSGVRVKKSAFDGEVTNSVNIKNSKIGDLE